MLCSSGGEICTALNPAGPRDRKSTRLNSSHLVISYAVFCLKKKKKTTTSFLTSPLTTSTFSFQVIHCSTLIYSPSPSCSSRYSPFSSPLALILPHASSSLTL